MTTSRVGHLIDATTAEMVRKCADNLERWRTDRDGYMRHMRDEGAALRQIAAAANMTAAGVKKILDRKQEG